MKGSYARGAEEIMRSELSLEYADDPYHLAKFGAMIKNLTEEVGYRNFTYEFTGVHEASELELNLEGSFGIQPHLYKMLSSGFYKRSYLPLQKLDMYGYLDIINKTIHFYVSFRNISMSFGN